MGVVWRYRQLPVWARTKAKPLHESAHFFSEMKNRISIRALEYEHAQQEHSRQPETHYCGITKEQSAEIAFGCDN